MSMSATLIVIIHQLFLIKTMRLMSAFDDSLSIFFCGIPPMHLMPLILLALNALPSIVRAPRWDWPTEG